MVFSLKSVHVGFDLSTMSGELYEEAIVDVVSPEAIFSKPYVVKVNTVTVSTHTTVADETIGPPLGRDQRPRA